MAPFDLKAWLVSTGFSEDGAAEVVTRASADNVDIDGIGKSVLRQADYSRQMDEGKQEVAVALAAHQAADKKLNDEVAEWTKVRGASEASDTARVAKIATLEQEKLLARQQVEQLAATAGVDPAPYLARLEIPVTPPAGTPVVPPVGTPPAVVAPPDLTGYVKTEDAAQVNRYMFETTMALPGLAAEHLALTGEVLDTAALGTEIQRRAAANETFTPRKVWEGMHEIPAKRAEAAKTAHDAEILAAENRGREAALSEATLPVGGPAGKRAIVFQEGPDGKPHESALARPQPNTRTDAAIAALGSGKYRPAPVAGPPA